MRVQRTRMGGWGVALLLLPQTKRVLLGVGKARLSGRGKRIRGVSKNAPPTEEKTRPGLWLHTKNHQCSWGGV